MKCDVCLTKIPLGQNRCPNCGFVVKPDIASSFDETSSLHEHIKVSNKKKVDGTEEPFSISNFFEDIKQDVKGTFSEVKSNINANTDPVNKLFDVNNIKKNKARKRRKGNKPAVGVLFGTLFSVFIVAFVIIAVVGVILFDSPSSDLINGLENYIDTNAENGTYCYNGSDDTSLEIVQDDIYYDVNAYDSYDENDNEVCHVTIRVNSDIDVKKKKQAIVVGTEAMQLIDEYFDSDIASAINKEYAKVTKEGYDYFSEGDHKFQKTSDNTCYVYINLTEGDISENKYYHNYTVDFNCFYDDGKVVYQMED